MAASKRQAKSKDPACNNFLRQFRDTKTRKFREISATKFIEVWNHYDLDGNGYIEGSELDNFLLELVTCVNVQEGEPQTVSKAILQEAKTSILRVFDKNKDGKIDISELAQLLPMEENFLLLFRRDQPLESSVEFMKTWRKYDQDHSGFIEADELKHFLKDLLNSMERSVSDEQLITYADTMLQLFDRNKDGKLQLSEMAKLLPVKENFLMRPVFKGAKQLTTQDINRVFNLYDRDGNKSIEDEELHGFLKDLMELVQEDYDADDIEEVKQILLRECDLNHDGKIDRDELAMVLVSFAKASQMLDDIPDIEDDTSGDAEHE